MLDEEFDLRPYLRALLDGWIWILLSILLAAIIAFGVSLVIPPTYEAHALVLITEPRNVVQLNPESAGSQPELPRQAFPEIALGDTVLTQLLVELPAGTPDLATLTDLREQLDVNAPTDPSLLRLTVAYDDADLAAEIVNAWATIFIAESNLAIGTRNDSQLDAYGRQRDDARTALTAAEEALIDFSASDRSPLLLSSLSVLTRTRQTQLEQLQSLTALEDAIALQRQLLNESGSAGDRLALLLIQTQALGLDVDLPVEIQLDTATAEDVDPAAQNALLDAIDASLADHADQLTGRLQDAEPAILQLQRDLEALQVEEERLHRTAELADETFTALARKVDEQRILAQDISAGLRLTSAAAPPDEPAAPRKELNAVVGAVLGAFIGAAALLYDRWRRRVLSG